MTNGELRTQIEEFASAFAAIPAITEPPKTSLEIARRQTTEKYWNRFLRYFLDPTAPHGFKSDFLREFIELVEQHTDAVGLIDAGIDEVKIQSEVRSDRGRPDLLIFLEGEWFICIELKVTATESGEQTKEYARSKQLGNLDVSAYDEENRLYLYLTKYSQSAPSSGSFSRIYWSDVESSMGQFLQNARGQYTARAMSQLADFRDTIRKETMSHQPYDTQQQEYVELYLEKADAIDTVRQAFDRMVQNQTDTWATRFLEHYRPESWDDTWNCPGDKYGKIFKDEWRLDKNGKEVEGWKEAAFRLEFRHSIRKARSWREGEVIFQTVIPRNSNDNYRDRCADVFNQYTASIREVTTPNMVIKGNQRTLIEAKYSFESTDGPDGYFSTLAKAFEDHVHLTPQLTDIFEETYQGLIPIE